MDDGCGCRVLVILAVEFFGGTNFGFAFVVGIDFDDGNGGGEVRLQKKLVLTEMGTSL